MGSFDLTINPFSLLGLTPRNDRSEITSAYEEALADGLGEEHEVIRAQQALMASKSRLDAEASWLFDAAPSRVRSILDALRGRPNDDDVRGLFEGVNGLAQANLAAHFCANGLAKTEILKMLIGAQDSYSAESVLGSVNANRAVSGFPKVDFELVEQALRTLKGRHRDAALEALTFTEHPGKNMIALVESFFDSTGPVHQFLEDLAERYDSWSTPRLREIGDEIDSAANSLKSKPGDQSAIDVIVEKLATWDEYSQPLQLLYEAKGLDEPRSRTLYDSLRDLCLWLANEQGNFEAALRISKALLHTFPELPSVMEQSSEDIETLEELVEQAKGHEIFSDLVVVATEAVEQAGTLIRSVAVNGEFAPGKEGLAGRLYHEFQLAAQKAEGSHIASMPWQIVRSVVVGFVNAHESGEVPLIMLERLAKHQDPAPPADVLESLESDMKVLKRNSIQQELLWVMEKGEWRNASELLDQSIDLTDDAEEKAELEKVRDTVRSHIKSRRRKWIIRGAIAAAIATWIALSAQKDENSPKSEKKPPVGTGRVLSKAELRYCLFQAERLKIALPLVLSQTQILWVNSMIRDWRSRCGTAKSYERDTSAVKSELRSARSRLREEGRSMVSPRR